MVKVIDEYFFFADYLSENEIILSDLEKHHIINVLRISDNTCINLTNGEGKIARATISKTSKKDVEFSDITIETCPPPAYFLHLAVAPTKNISRFEWFLEKATEIGVSEITPIFTENSERKHVRLDRLDKILLTATKQSKKVWKPKLNAPCEIEKFLNKQHDSQKLIAYIDQKAQHLKHVLQNNMSHLVLIGPEGGFSSAEFEQSRKYGYEPVSLGDSRLRAETAGVFTAGVVNIHYVK